tara:strand:- start:505 stop:924 length:420 start_codon:yes stop_codon:yes gene_type:complete
LSDKISDKDKIDWQNFLNSKEKLHNKDFKEIAKKNLQIKSLDLHGHTLEQANQIVERFIRKSYDEKVGKIKIVTGKGLHSKNENDPYVSKDLGILKYSVPEFINKNKDLMKKIKGIEEAEIKDGGSGALFIYLKNQDKF